MGTVLINVNNGLESQMRIHEKGSPEQILKCCTQILNK